MGDLLLNLALFGTVVVASVTDLGSRRIPNLLTVGTAALGLGLNGLFFGPEGFLLSLQGWLLGMAILLPLFLLGALGAGDVKLMAAIGAMRGPEFVFYAALWGAVAGGGMALVGLIQSGKLGLALRHIYYFKVLPGPRGGSLITAARLPYGPAIAIGTTVVLGGVRWIS